MSIPIPLALYPVAVIQDRYQGVYSDGAWLAIADADEPHSEMARASWALTCGPGGGGIEACRFWGSPPDWIGAGATCEGAIAQLLERHR
jgi:hypothetical protein